MPTPVSITLKQICCCSGESLGNKSILRVILPILVNLTALVNKLPNTCCKRILSHIRLGAIKGSISIINSISLFSHKGAVKLSQISTSSTMLNGASFNCAATLSTRAKSSILLSINNKLCAACLACAVCSNCFGVSPCSISISSKPNTAFSGVRIS